MSKIVLVTAPALEPVSLDDIKSHLRVDIDDDDELIMSYMLTARSQCEKIAGSFFVDQTYKIFEDGFPGSNVWALPRHMSPLESVTHIKYYDENDQASTFAATNYVVDSYSSPCRIILKSTAAWPGDVLRVANGVELQVVVGFGDPPDVPDHYKQAIKLLVGHYYENRETVIVGSQVNELPMGVKDLLWLDRNKVF